MVTHHCEYTKTQDIIHFKMVKIVNFMLHVLFISIKKISCNSQKILYNMCKLYDSVFNVMVLLKNSRTPSLTYSLGWLWHCNCRGEKLQQRLHSSKN